VTASVNAIAIGVNVYRFDDTVTMYVSPTVTSSNRKYPKEDERAGLTFPFACESITIAFVRPDPSGVSMRPVIETAAAVGACASNAPMSAPSPPAAFGDEAKSTGRASPRWSANEPNELPLSIAGLLFSKLRVGTRRVPPLSARGPRLG